MTNGNTERGWKREKKEEGAFDGGGVAEGSPAFS